MSSARQHFSPRFAARDGLTRVAPSKHPYTKHTHTHTQHYRLYWITAHAAQHTMRLWLFRICLWVQLAENRWMPSIDYVWAILHKHIIIVCKFAYFVESTRGWINVKGDWHRLVRTLLVTAAVNHTHSERGDASTARILFRSHRNVSNYWQSDKHNNTRRLCTCTYCSSLFPMKMSNFEVGTL